MSNRKLFKIAGLVGLITIVSKVFGLVRDLVIARAFGTTITADAYNFAYLLTGNALILLGGLGGPFHSATIATLTKLKNDPKEAGSFLIKIFSFTFLILSIITIFVLYYKTQIVQFIAPASGHDMAYREKLWQLTEMQLQIMSPLIVISGLLGILCGVGNVFGGYFWPSFSPVFPSIAIIICVFFFDPNRGEPLQAGVALGIGTLIGAFFQLLFQLPDLFNATKKKYLELAVVKNKEAISDFTYFLGPALLSTTIGQITVYIDSFFCSGLDEGSWTATILANRLIQLPLGVLLTSFLVPFFPRFSELAHEKNFEKLKESSIMVIRSLWFLTLPVAVYLYLFARPIVELVFERGAFNARSSELTSSILIALLLSMIAYVARDTLTRVFYSLGNSRLPLIVAICSIMLKIILNSILVKEFEAPGIAFATSIVTVFNFLFLWYMLRKDIGSLGWSKNLGSLMKMLIATAIMYIFGYLFIEYFPSSIERHDTISKFIFILGSSMMCFLIYFSLSLRLKIEEAEKVFIEIRKKIKPLHH
jgi:putative peptidoglycan lipid II flippase